MTIRELKLEEIEMVVGGATYEECRAIAEEGAAQAQEQYGSSRIVDTADPYTNTNTMRVEYQDHNGEWQDYGAGECSYQPPE